MESPPVAPRDTPLRAEHEALGASFTDFGGWMMPVRYGSDLAEHHAVRQAAGLFDISHMGEILVTGDRAGAFLDHALAGRLSALAVGKAKYTMILAEDGGIIDDLIVYRLADDRFLVVANAGNREVVAAALEERAAALRSSPGGAFPSLDGGDPGSSTGAAQPRSGDGSSERSESRPADAAPFGFIAGMPQAVTVEDVSDAHALIAVQGPAAQAILEATPGITELDTPWAEQGYYAWASARFDDAPLLIARTGYTGEDGFELMIPVDRAAALWRALLAAGEPHGLVPAGLAARDTLRLEAGMPLYGHELSRSILPAQAGLGRVIPADKTGFVGEAAKEPRPDAPVLVGLTLEGRRAGREGYAVHLGDEKVGEVTSGALSPTLAHPIALAYVRPDVAASPDLTIDVRGTRIPAAVTALPFYRRKK
ncbi:glycine cleavage system aminomethyltransferase GcvT [Microbacterium sediminis]|uniref:Aminomethyltransferase n=1 Tax=Microbacterium sediminis TaxID=904291 RepID=A0A1B9NG10_9MICO|nr:glycine cleavage system aminomethyltransferase GcvT [Microbacterium sediminis]OCG75532.1 glycine cleavage system protein T [Microbacterium sediminis]QBR73927.1 glycine cleavage system protein T [Microbacterium sediminis]